MESFRFRCITVAKVETSKGFFLKAINEEGPVELFLYGKKTPIDGMVYMEVAGLKKNTNKDYLVVKSMDIISRFQQIRGSFSKLSYAMSMIEIAYITKIELNLILNGLKMLEKYSYKTAYIWFLSSFLLKNGIFNKNAFSKQQLSAITFILNSQNKERLKLKETEFRSLSDKLIGFIEDYADSPFSKQPWSSKA